MISDVEAEYRQDILRNKAAWDEIPATIELC